MIRTHLEAYRNEEHHPTSTSNVTSTAHTSLLYQLHQDKDESLSLQISYHSLTKK